MKIGIYCSIDTGNVKDKSIDYIGVDGGLVHLLNQDIKPILVIGDMDSLEDHKLLEQHKIKRYPVIKDDTDTALAIKYAIKHGYNEIDLYGVTKKRLDHFIAVLILIRQYKHCLINIYDEHNKICILNPGIHKVYKDIYKYFSIFAFEDTYISLKGCKYPLDNYLLKDTDPLCVSNEILEEYSIIENDHSVLFIQSI